MPEAADTLKEWAVLVYICADVPQPGIKRASHANLLQMADTGSSSEVWVAAQLANPGPWTYRYIFPERPPGSPAAIIKAAHAIPSVNSGVPGSLEDFFAWASKACPAKNTMLVLWGHGYGIDYYVPPEFAADAASERPAANVGSGAFVAQPRYAFGPDYKWKTAMDDRQIGDAVRACAKSLPPQQNLAILGFDACVMAMAEVWSEMQGAASIGIASQAALPYFSWPYDGFLNRLLQQPTARPVEVAQMLVDAFANFYAEHHTDCVTISACDLTRIAQLEQSVKPLAQALAETSANPQARQSIFEARKYCPEYDEQGFIDLGCFCQFLEITMPDSPVSHACGPVVQSISNLVISSKYSPPDPNKRVSLSTGVSVWLPSWINDPAAYAIEKDLAEAYLTNGYPQTEFPSATGWDKFLVKFRDQAWGAGDEAGKERFWRRWLQNAM